MVFRMGRAACGNKKEATRREWLVTNGIGGFASGTVSGIPTRHYHGLLVAALNPPLGRTVLLNKLDEVVQYQGEAYLLSANMWASGATLPRGFRQLESFRLEGTTPVWQYACGDALIEKRVWMAQGENTTYVRYDVLRASAPVEINIKALANYRDFHSGTRANGWHMDVQAVDHGVGVSAYEGAVPFYLLCEGADVTLENSWYRDYTLSLETYRGQDSYDDALLVGTFAVVLGAGESVGFVASTEQSAELDAQKTYKAQQAYEQALIKRSELADASANVQHLVLAADQFVVERAVNGKPGKTVIAGYHWFGDWGRDTMISLSGLTLSTRRYDVAESILRTFGQFVDQGMLPNRFPDAAEMPEYNTVDATLWYFEAIRAYHAATGDDKLVRDLFPVLQEIITCHEKGTRYNIHVDPEDGLLRAGEDGVQLTWMDAKVGDWVVTPRTGKPIEVNALWYNALMTMEAFAAQLGETDNPYTDKAERVKASFQRFWNANAGYCYDVLDAPNGFSTNDYSLRPNQLFAVSLPYSPLTVEQKKGVLEACARELLTSHGLRSLSPHHADYVPVYRGGSVQRDGAYHQGTVWAWLIGAFVEAHLRVYGDKQTARSFLVPLVEDQLGAGCIGNLSEIFDAEPPFEPRGAVAQAWSVAEVLRAWLLTEPD